VKFDATAGALASALSAATLALEKKRSVIEALTMVRVSAAMRRAAFAVNSIDREIVVNVPVTTIAPGEVAVRCSSLADLLAKIKPDQVVQLAQSDDDITVTASRSRFKIHGLPISDLPAAMALTETAVEIEIATEELARLIEVTLLAMADEETRFYLNGLYLHAADAATLVAVATNGHRLAHYSQELPLGAQNIPAIIIPNQTVEIIAKLLRRKDIPEDITLRVSDRLFEMILPDMRVTSKLVDATYPDYRRVIPRDYKVSAVVDRAELQVALARIAATMNPDFKKSAHVAGLTWTDGALHVMRVEQGADSDAALEAETIGKGCAALKIVYVEDALAALGGKRVRIEHADNGVAVRFSNPDDANAFVIVMPITWK
jgi:DNA polymerase-3 subunit beta